MANIDVEPKSNNSFVTTTLIAAALLALLYFLAKGCTQNNETTNSPYKHTETLIKQNAVFNNEKVFVL